MTTVLGLSFSAGLSESSDIGYARAKAMAMLSFWSAGLVLYFTRLKTWGAISVFAGTVLSAIVLVQIAPLGRLLQISPLHFLDWVMIVVSVIAALLLIKMGESV